MQGQTSGIGMMVRFCIVTGKPADKSKFNLVLRRISPELADIMTEVLECKPDG